MQRPYTVSAVRVHPPAVEQQLKQSQVPLPRCPKHSISQGCFFLEDKYTPQKLTIMALGMLRVDSKDGRVHPGVEHGDVPTKERQVSHQSSVQNDQ